MVRTERLTLKVLLSLVMLAGIPSSADVSSVHSRRAGTPALKIAWVDYDLEPARKVFAQFAPHLQAQTAALARPVDLEFVGTNVADHPNLLQDMRRLVMRRPALIVATSVSVARALLQLHSSIPVYFVSQSDPIRDGLVTSLIANGPLTGYTYFVPLDVKAMELITRVFPERRTVGIVADSLWLAGHAMSRNFFESSTDLGLKLVVFNLNSEQEIRDLPRDPRTRDVEVWYVPYDQLPFEYGELIAETLGRTKLPTIYGRRKFLALGGLLSLQAVDSHAMDVWAKSIVNILSGVPVGSIPIMRPKEVEIAANSAAVGRLDLDTRNRIAREATIFE
jgi:putative tryptophan/tyrosine transport system substrate-binding protein